MLSNGTAGVYFNDSTKMILKYEDRNFYYIERGNNKKDLITKYEIGQVPEKLYKKFALLQHFKSYLEADEDSFANDLNEKSENFYVKKWLRTKRAILFRFTDKCVQVSFQDKTEVILSNEAKIVTYVNKKKERISLPMTSAVESADPEMAKRIKYTRDILNYMMSGRHHQNA